MSVDNVFWFTDVKLKSLKEASEQDHLENDYLRGYNAGIQFAAKVYEEEMKRLRQRVEGYLEEDVDLSGGEEHVS